MKLISCALFYLLSLVIIGLTNSFSYAQAAANLFPQYDLTIRLSPDVHRLEANGTLRLPMADASR